ncbi:zinc finger protein 567-like [Ochlerotatus camptorhynchus]|uniref:zinc finger protein 567-like n=1 Tax=Ochlerotatus camptorhynchus TaxID=644619 RepID=UPI0031DAE527
MDDGLKMEISISPATEYKICVICAQACEENYYASDGTVDRLSLEDILQYIFVKLQISFDVCLVLNLCDVCKGELTVAYRFIKKVEEASLKIRSILAADETRDPLNWSISIEDNSVKSGEADDSSVQNCLELETEEHSKRRRTSVQEADVDCTSFNYNAATSEDEEKFDTKRFVFDLESQPVRCCGCKEPLSTNEQVQSHSEAFHRRNKITDRQINENKPFECLVCFQRFQLKKDYRQHQRKMYVDELHSCRRCPADFANAHSLRVHEKTVHKRLKINQQIDEMRQRVHKCCICREQFDSLDLVKDHVEKNHPSQGDNMESNNQFECEICCRRYKTQKVLIEHQRRPFRKHRFQCSHCGKTFKEKQAFIDHEQSHVNIRPYECPICQMRFSLKPNFLTHVRYHSVPSDQFKCTFCGKGFRKKHILQEHQLIHNKSELRPFKCHICSIAFTRKDLLDFHVKDHLGEKPFKCTQCTASYIYERDLRRHNRAKHEGLTFVCEICYRPFSRKDAYKKHTRTHRLENS